MPLANDPNKYNRAIVQVTMSQTMRDLVDAEAGKDNKSLAEFCRIVLAEYIGYDLSKDAETKVDRRGRKPTYANAEERRIANNERQRNRYQAARQMLQDFKRDLGIRDRENIADSLRRRGVKIDDD